MQHLRLFSPNLRCHLQVPAGNDGLELLLLLLLLELVDEAFGKRLNPGLLWLRWPRLRLRPLSFPLEFPWRIWLTSESSSLKAEVKGDAEDDV